MLERFFKLKSNNTTISGEFVAGLTTFVSMSYILVVVPSLLQKAGMPFNGTYIGTILVACFGTVLIGLTSNYPIAIAPGVGTLAYFVFSIVLNTNNRVTWKEGMAIVFVTGVLFSLISLTKLRRNIIVAIPDNLKHAIVAGIGLFIGIIGLSGAGIIESGGGTIVHLGKITSPMVLLALFGFFLAAILSIKNIPGGIFIAMIMSAVIAFFAKLMPIPKSFISLPSGVTETFMQINFSAFNNLHVFLPILLLLLILMFDTTGTLIGLTTQAGLLKNGKMEKDKSAFLSDSVTSIFASFVGSSPSAVYIESGAGIAVGGRTGLTAIFTALFFMLCAFFQPVAKSIGSCPAITTPALLMVAYFMARNVAEIDWKNFDESLASFIIIIGIPLSYSIASGVGLGIITFVIIRLGLGKFKTVHPLLYVFAALFAASFSII